jgi:hypothetical protein
MGANFTVTVVILYAKRASEKFFFGCYTKDIISTRQGYTMFHGTKNNHIQLRE